MKTKKELPEGYRMYITHYRRFPETETYMTRFDASTEGFEQPLHTGGATEASIVNEEGEIVAMGLSLCSERENFNKKIGRDIAKGRAFKSWGLGE